MTVLFRFLPTILINSLISVPLKLAAYSTADTESDNPVNKKSAALANPFLIFVRKRVNHSIKTPKLVIAG